jgi:hypothetical protein
MKRTGRKKEASRLEERAQAIREEDLETLRTGAVVDVRDLQTTTGFQPR